jgi:hypothetical protein
MRPNEKEDNDDDAPPDIRVSSYRKSTAKLIGRRIESQAKFPLGAIFWFVLAACCSVPAVVLLNPHPAIFAVLPCAIGLALLLVRERPFKAELTREGLEIEDPPLVLPYAEIESVLGPKKQRQAPIQIHFSGGVMRIPARLNVRSDELYWFLLDQLPPNSSRELPAVLARYCAEQEARYGPDRVFSHRARPQRFIRRRKYGIFIVGTACVLAGLIWLLVGVLLPKDGQPWIVLGITLTFFSAFFTGLLILSQSFESAGSQIKNWRGSGLVISPEGLAMIQGDMKGELRWDELRDIRFRPKPAFFGFQSAGTNMQGIHLIVAGATIVIVDLYDRPLEMIHEQLRAYW